MKSVSVVKLNCNNYINDQCIRPLRYRESAFNRWSRSIHCNLASVVERFGVYHRSGSILTNFVPCRSMSLIYLYYINYMRLERFWWKHWCSLTPITIDHKIIRFLRERKFIFTTVCNRLILMIWRLQKHNNYEFTSNCNNL